jgi:hypothetical protein
MKFPWAVAAVLIGVAGCSANSDLTPADKARAVAELILDNAECRSFRQRLLAPGLDSPGIREIYEAGRRARCLKPTV